MTAGLDRAYDHQHKSQRETLLWEAVGQACPLCGYEMRIGQALDLDHEVPISKGGRGGPVRITHAECNRARQDRDVVAIRARGPREIRACEICAQAYWPSYDRQRCCSRPCGVELQRRNRPSKPPKPEPKPRRCSECDATYVRHGLALTCSAECGKRRNNRLTSARIMAEYVPRPLVDLMCGECGQPFMGHGNRRYCSEDCRAQVERRRRAMQKARARLRKRTGGGHVDL